MMTSFGEFWYTIGLLALLAIAAAIVWECMHWWTQHPDHKAVQQMHRLWQRIHIRHGH